MKRRPLTSEQFEAIDRLSVLSPGRWKEALRKVWDGDSWPASWVLDDEAVLRTLRGTHGPMWLVKFNLARERRERQAISAAARAMGGEP